MINPSFEHKKRVSHTKNICTKIDSREIPVGSEEVRLFVVARNEALRLPYFLKYYLELGVDRIFVIDNNSTDDTVKIACSTENAHVFKIDHSFKEFWNWIEYFLNEYGRDRWCIVVDIDELLFYPLIENLNIKEFIYYLNKKNYTAFRSFLLDLYPEGPIRETNYLAGADPLEICPYFDPHYNLMEGNFFDKNRWASFSWTMVIGGVRQRIFGNTKERNWVFCLSKVPLFKYAEGVYLTEGMHAINGACVADVEGIVLHTKFMQDFVQKVCEESLREEHYLNGVEYKIYQKHLTDNPSLTFKNENSVFFKDSIQLINLGLMKISEDYKTYLLGFS